MDMTFNLRNYVSENFNGILVIGDVHGDIDAFMRAVNLATEQKLFFISLGDLVDRGRHPWEVVTKMHELMTNKLGAFVIGNHDNKFHRLAKGRSVSLSRDSTQTLVDVGDERKDAFLKMYTEINEWPFLADNFHIFDDLLLVHAATHKEMWDSSKYLTDEARYMGYFGEVDGSKYENGFPVRMYNWINDIPNGKTAIVGHDRSAVFNIPLLEPLRQNNENGGKVVFLDTGCGKGGYLSGAILKDQNGFKIISYVGFK